MSRFKTCRCGRRVRVGQPCVCGAGVPRPVDEAKRMERQPYRVAYKHPSYRKARGERLRMAGWKCEECGVPLRRKRYPTGALWECDHVIEVRRFADPLDANTVGNLRVLCKACHKRKTAGRHQ